MDHVQVFYENLFIIIATSLMSFGDKNTRANHSLARDETTFSRFQDVLISANKFQDPSIRDGVPVEFPRQQNRLTKDPVDPSTTDRDIPRFLQDDLEEVLGISHSEKLSSFHSK